MANDNSFLNLPNVIMPGETAIRRAISNINNKFPGFFDGVKEIRIAPGMSGYGYVTNKKEDEGIIFVDFNRIKSELSSNFGNQNEEALEEALVSALSETIAHEKGHIEKNLEGGEFPAEQRAREVMNRLSFLVEVFYKKARK
jgi:hypothetical protein